MNKKYDLCSLGEIMIRLSPPENERICNSLVFEKNVAGAELNVAAGSALLGMKTAMLSVLPDNHLGTYARNMMKKMGVDERYVLKDVEADARLGMYYYEYGSYPRKPQVIYDRKHSSFLKIAESNFPEDIYTECKCFHTTGITLGLGGNAREAAIQMIQKFKKGGAVISFDVNFRGNLWSGAEAKECIEQILPYVDIFFCSEDTARLTFLKEGSLETIMKSFAKEYPQMKVIVATRRIVHSPKVHSFGSLLYNTEEDKFYEEEAYERIEVVDRIGSGDAYISGALYGLLNGDMDCQKAVAYGNAVAAAKCTIPGDLPQCGLEDIDGIIKDHQNHGRVSEMNR